MPFEIYRDLAGEESPSFVERWSGKFELAERDDTRYRALVEKYL